MKKIFFIIMVLLCNNLFAQYEGFIRIKTPTNVEIEAINYFEVLPDDLAGFEADAAAWINRYKSKAVRIAPASHRYNCHGYAWHLSDGGDSCYIRDYTRHENPNLSKYWTDSPIYQVTNSLYGTKVNYPDGQHSAITTDQEGIVISKWARWPLYRHAPNDCPYTSTNLQYYYIPVTGDNLICSSKTYSTLNISGASYNWSGSRLSLTSSGSSATATKTSNGSGWINVQISSPYSETTVLAKKTVWVGNAGQPTITPSGYPTVEMQVGERKSFRSTSTPGYPTSYRWYITGHPSGVEISSGSTSKYCTMLANNPSWNNFYFQTTNACGTSANAGGAIKVIEGGGGGMYSPLIIYPNPASSEINISISDSIYSEYNVNEYEIEIYDNNNTLKLKEKGIEKEKGINVGHLKFGIYTVRLKYNNKVYTEKFIIQ